MTNTQDLTDWIAHQLDLLACEMVHDDLTPRSQGNVFSWNTGEPSCMFTTEQQKRFKTKAIAAEKLAKQSGKLMQPVNTLFQTRTNTDKRDPVVAYSKAVVG